MRSTVLKRSVVVAGHKTSISLEDTFWNALREIADAKKQTISSLVGDIAARKDSSNLSSSIRVFVLRSIVTPERAGQLKAA